MAGIQAVRWFILGDAWAIGTPTYANGDWSYSLSDPLPDGVDSLFKDFEKLLQAFQAAKMKLVPVLVDYLFFARGRVVLSNNPAHPAELPVTGSGSVDDFAQEQFKSDPALRKTKGLVDWNSYVKGGKGSILTKPATIADFMTRLFKPLLDISTNAKYKDVVLAWDICNEPDEGVENHHVPGGLMGDFLMAGVTATVKAGLSATIGFKSSDGPTRFADSETLNFATLQQLTVRGRYYPQFHFYPETSPNTSLITPTWAPEARWWVGEFATDFGQTEGQSWAGAWPPSVLQRLQTVAQSRFGWAFPWAYRHAKRANWGAQAWSDVKTFNGIP